MIEVVISAVRDKFELTRLNSATLIVGVPAAGINDLQYHQWVYVLDIVRPLHQPYIWPRVASMIVLAWVARAIPGLARHMNYTGRSGWAR